MMKRNGKGQFEKGVKKSENWYKSMSKRCGSNHKMWKGGKKIEIIPCRCGCGLLMDKYDSRNRIRKRILGHQMVGRKQSEFHRIRMTGKNNPNWVEDREKLKKGDKRNEDADYRVWQRIVKNRDKWKCRVMNDECSGKLEAHHIQPWSKFPELRYDVNNGISLCHYHHPKTRKDEEKFAPIFQKIVIRPFFEKAT